MPEADPARRPGNRTSRRSFLLASLAAATALTSCATPAPAPTRSATPAPIEDPATNLAHLTTLTADVRLTTVPGHTTYEIEAEPTARALWFTSTKAADGSYKPQGLGEPREGRWGTGAFRADDLCLGAVAFLRHAKLFSDAASLDTAYHLLRTAAYLQTAEGPTTGLVVRWMQPDGTLNPNNSEVSDGGYLSPSLTANPTDSAVSLWFAHWVWAVGEGYGAFKDTRPEFADFLRKRLVLAVDVIERELARDTAAPVDGTGRRVPTGLLREATDATSAAVVGLSRYARDVGGDSRVERLLKSMTDALSTQRSGSTNQWPFGAVLSWAASPSLWNAEGSEAPSALARSAPALKRSDVLDAALEDTAGFTPFLLTYGGVDSRLSPLVSDARQTPQAVSARLRSLLDVASQAEADGLYHLAAYVGGWFFGANKAGKAPRDGNGAFYDSLREDRTFDTASSAEANAHGVLAMLALDAHPQVKRHARAYTASPSVEGVRVLGVEAAALAGSAAVEKAPSAWTGEADLSRGVLRMREGSSATWDLGASFQPRHLFPVTVRPLSGTASLSWSAGGAELGRSDLSGTGPQGISPSDLTVLPEAVDTPLPPNATTVRAVAKGSCALAALLVRDEVSKIDAGDGKNRRILFVGVGADVVEFPVTIPGPGPWEVKVYDSKGRYVSTKALANVKPAVTVVPGGFSVMQVRAESTAPSPSPS